MSYAFIDFESTESAALAVSRYHEGWFMENQIRVELSMHGKKPNLHPNVKSGPPPPATAAASQACFKCGKPGHKIKDCRSQVDIRWVLLYDNC
jgi:RNA recognition motif-containing protein